jgi:hypothetical protein
MYAHSHMHTARVSERTTQKRTCCFSLAVTSYLLSFFSLFITYLRICVPIGELHARRKVAKACLSINLIAVISYTPYYVMHAVRKASKATRKRRRRKKSHSTALAQAMAWHGIACYRWTNRNLSTYPSYIGGQADWILHCMDICMCVCSFGRGWRGVSTFQLNTPT